MPRSFLVKKVKYPVVNHHSGGGPRWYREPSSPTEASPVPSPQPSSPSRGGDAVPAYGEYPGPFEAHGAERQPLVERARPARDSASFPTASSNVAFPIRKGTVPVPT